SNIYLIGCKKTREAALIDFGGYGAATIDKYLNSNGLKLKALLLTHGHNDHIWGASLIENIYKVPVYINQSDRNWFDSMTGIYKRAGLTHNAIPLNFVFVNDKDKINIGNIAIEVIHTPGHSKGSVCYYIPFERSLFTGDTLFKNAVGNINFAGGSRKELKDSVLRLLTLPEYTNIYAGHLDQTTIKQEKVNNMVYSF
ncbi:MAG: MBL fold metallo-hydrolase, partial [Cyanobacteriota bacterium]